MIAGTACIDCGRMLLSFLYTSRVLAVCSCTLHVLMSQTGFTTTLMLGWHSYISRVRQNTDSLLSRQSCITMLQQLLLPAWLAELHQHACTRLCMLLSGSCSAQHAGMLFSTYKLSVMTAGFTCAHGHLGLQQHPAAGADVCL